ncbi:hypothetical protein CTheo_3573 [Ceratobasidium theobromae]|uniref:Uncharacterized protein n=1 Tax=Ceratobasidium theobromae TaxID=1582974 RepID=A0A5N5QMZ4_9AGAM|nr:hypothetical protein CTheo_3573 [Ceratobasidium theobromae]
MEHTWHQGLRAGVWIASANSKATELPVHQYRDLDDFTGESWITSVEGQKFEICWSADILGSDPKLQSLDLRATVWLDGIQIAGGVLEAESIAKGEYASISGQLIAADKERPCEFGTLTLTDNDDDQIDTITPDDLNTIRVELQWGRLAILGSPVRVRVPLELDSANPYSFRPKRDLEAVTYIARHASQALLEAQSILTPKLKPQEDRDIIDIDDIKSELDLDIVQRQRRVHNLGTIDISDTKSEPDSSSLSDTGGLDDSDEIIFVKHMVPISMLLKEKLRTSSRAVKEESASDPELDNAANKGDSSIPVRTPPSPKSPSKKAVRITEAESPQQRRESSGKGKAREISVPTGPAASAPALPSPPPSPPTHRIGLRPRPADRCSSGLPVTHIQLGEVSKRLGIVHVQETFECENAVDPVRLLTLSRGTLINDARARGGNALVDEVWEYTVSKRGKAGYVVKVLYTAGAALVEGTTGPQKPVALDIAKTKGINGLMTLTSRH